MEYNYRYVPSGVCSREFYFFIEEGKIKGFQAVGGCNGNLKGISQLLIDRKIDDVISLLEGLTCGMKATSCPDQIAQALKAYNG